MIRLFGYILLLSTLAILAGCATAEPVWRAKAITSLQQLEGEDAARIRPEAFNSIKETVRHGEKLLVDEDDDELADLQYQLAFQKSQILKADLAAYRAQMAEKARREAEEELARKEKEELAARAAEEERLRAAAARSAGVKTGPGAENGNGQVNREKATLPSTYIVRRGESLPQIASRPEVYNESGLWPLIYRANRDQVRDPYQLWPGQVLKIPRSYSREEAVEARKQSHRRTP